MQEIANSSAQPPELTDEQRDLIRAYFDEHPDGGYKNACKAAGILRLTQKEAKALIGDDAELAEYRMRKLGLDEGSLFQRLGEMAQNKEHKDQFRAITFGLGAIHGRSESARLELTGPDGGPIQTEKREVSLTGVLHVLAEAGALPDELAGPLRHLAAPRDVLPAQPD
jgi:hypothetical protein